MHFHDNPTDTQNQSALTHEVSLPNTTPLRTFEALRGVLSAIKPNYFHPQVVSPTCTSNFYVSISSDTVRNSATSSETEDVATTRQQKLTFEFWSWEQSTATSCTESKFANRRNSQRSWQREEWQAMSANIIVVKVVKDFTTTNDSWKRPLQVIDVKRKDFYKLRKQEFPRRQFPK